VRTASCVSVRAATGCDTCIPHSHCIGDSGVAPGQADHGSACVNRTTLPMCDGDSDTSSLRFKPSARRWVTKRARSLGESPVPGEQVRLRLHRSTRRLADQRTSNYECWLFCSGWLRKDHIPSAPRRHYDPDTRTCASPHAEMGFTWRNSGNSGDTSAVICT